MSILGVGTETYLYLNGISCSHEIELRKGIMFMPAYLNAKIEKISHLLKSDIDFSIATLSFRNLSSQLSITASDSEQLAVKAWNAQWDCLLLGALFNCEVMCNIQCDKSIGNIEEASYISVTNYNLRALLKDRYCLSKDDEVWIQNFYNNAIILMENTEYSNAVYAMATYKWHSMPYLQLSILWSGIEALFNIKRKISSKIGIRIAKFLSKENIDEYNEQIKKLYKMRSLSVHGNEIKDKEELLLVVNESALLLNEVIKCCAERCEIPSMLKN